MSNVVAIADYVRNAATDQSTGYSSVAALTFLAWDVALSFSDEVRLVWRQSNGWSRWLYAFIRYAPLLAEIVFFAYFAVPGTAPGFQGKPCRASTLAESIILESVILAVEIVLFVRVHALYHQSRAILVGLLAGLAASFCGTFIGMYYAADELRYDMQCLVRSAPRIMILVWISPIAFEAVLFVMTLLKFRESRREGLGRRPILDTIVCDGTWAFVLALVVLTANAVIYSAFSETLSGIFYFWAMSALSFIGSHVLLNLRQVANEQSLTWDSSLEPSAICFESNGLVLSDASIAA